MEITKPHAVLLASPGLGHLVPMLELGNRLSLHNFHVTVLVAATDSFPTRSQLTELSPPPDVLSVVKLSPPVDISGILEPGAGVLTKIVAMMRRSLPSLRSALSAMTTRPTALFVDFFGTEALEIAGELNLRKYVFVPCSAWFVAQTVHVPTLHGETKGQLIGEKEPLRLPGCKPIRRDAAFEPLWDREGRMCGEYVQIGAAMSAADGILVNSWEDLESVTLDALREDAIWGRFSKVPVHSIGPVVRSSRLSGTRSEISDWLDRQPNGSVVFVSFGSCGTLSARQIAELAWGLELSRQRFVWVVRPPSEDDSSATFFTVGSAGGGDGTPKYLPRGFCARTRGVGLVIQMWGPQEEILSHAAVGGFLSHCGWNSTVESIVNGVPMIAWPLYAEQSMNAALLTEELAVAVRPAAGEDGVVGRAEIGRMVRTIIEGEEEQAVRQRVRELKRGSIEALSKGGSSHTSLARLADECHKSARVPSSAN